MKDVFITSTIHDQWNLRFNLKLCKVLESRGISCYLPQRDTDQTKTAQEKFKTNISNIKDSKILLVVLINPTPNLGAEVGFAFGIGKKIIVLTSQNTKDIMVTGMASNIVKAVNPDILEDYIEDLVKLIRK